MTLKWIMMPDAVTVELERHMFWLWPDGDLDKPPELWERRGHCNRCGKCCEVSWGIRYKRAGDTVDGDPQQYGESEPLSWLKGVPAAAEDWDGHWVYWQRKSCEDRRACGKYQGNGVCGVYPDLPEICRKWPIIPDELAEHPNCGFWFERVEDA